MSSTSSKRLLRSDASPNWLELPVELTSSILHRLGTIEILEVVQKVCMTWRKICKDPTMWQSVDMRNTGDYKPYDLELMCWHAVDRSCGGLREINLEYFGTNNLLHYIVNRAPQLKSLGLACCDDISGQGLSEVATKLPNLEELHMFLIEVDKETIKNIGRCCPQVISLTYNIQGSRVHVEDGDGEAMAIAQTMPRLRHLSLFGNQMTNVGLQVILNKCPHLESLDLRQCFNVNLGGAFGRILAQKIKKLKQPYDSTDDYEFDTTVYEGYESDSYSNGYWSSWTDMEDLYDDYNSDASSMSENSNGNVDATAPITCCLCEGNRKIYF